MRSARRRAAIGATTAALLLAAVGSSFAALRAGRSEGGVMGASLGAARDGTADLATTLPPGARIPLPPDALEPRQPDVVDPATGLGPGPPDPAVGSAVLPGGAAPGGGAGPVAVVPADAPEQRTRSRAAPDPTLDPAAGPTPAPVPDPPADSCPSDSGAGAVPPPNGKLRAVDFTLPWPGGGPLVLLPQTSASRGSAPVRLAGTTAGSVAGDGLVLDTNPVVARYTLEAGAERSSGSIVFVPPGLLDNVELQACRDRSLVVHDVRKATLDGSPVRIVGVVAPAGTVTVTDDGGTARFQSATPGVYGVTLVTASDAGNAGPLVSASIRVP